MKPVINVGNRELSTTIIAQIKENNYVPFDIRITNSHITNLNKLTGRTLFRKDALYINSKTLWEIMQEGVGHGTHNYHGLSPEDIVLALEELDKPSVVINAKQNRLAIVTVSLSHFNEPLMIVIETGASLRGIINANVYKIVTIYPKSDMENYLKQMNRKDILYIK